MHSDFIDFKLIWCTFVPADSRVTRFVLPRKSVLQVALWTPVDLEELCPDVLPEVAHLLHRTCVHSREWDTVLQRVKNLIGHISGTDCRPYLQVFLGDF